MTLKIAPVDQQHPQRVALTYGPVVLVRPHESKLSAPATHISRCMYRAGEALQFRATNQPTGLFVPFYKVGAGSPYGMYFDLQA